MAYRNGKRTVYCRLCYEVGHNRRSCPKASETLKARYKDGDLARKCSYCKEKGHTKRKCETLAKDKQEYIKQNSQYRDFVMHSMEVQGLSIGCLVMPRGYTPEEIQARPEQIYMIVGVEWDDIQDRQKGNRVLQVRSIVNDEVAWFAVPRTNSSNDYYGYGQCTLLSNPRGDIRQHMPTGWLDGTSGTDKLF